MKRVQQKNRTARLRRFGASPGFRMFFTAYLRWTNYLILIPACIASTLGFFAAKFLYGVPLNELWLQGLLIVAILFPPVILLVLWAGSTIERELSGNNQQVLLSGNRALQGTPPNERQ